MEELINQKFENENGEIIYLTIDNFHGEINIRFDNGNEERFIGHANNIWFNGVYNFKLYNEKNVQSLDLSKGGTFMAYPIRYNRTKNE
ncbi:MAG: hypothetical protein JXB00_09495 [Bacteroidales bacterium]|nr:hypothetical protein [Bacteroidales bacterium]